MNRGHIGTTGTGVRRKLRPGRSPQPPARLRDEIEDLKDCQPTRRQQKRAPSTIEIILLTLSERGGQSIQNRALWLIDQANRRGASVDAAANLDAVCRWLRDPAGSSLDAALRPRATKARSTKTKLIPYVGADHKYFSKKI